MRSRDLALATSPVSLGQAWGPTLSLKFLEHSEVVRVQGYLHHLHISCSLTITFKNGDLMLTFVQV